MARLRVSLLFFLHEVIELILRLRFFEVHKLIKAEKRTYSELTKSFNGE
jgi:hypothetical protein